MSVAAFRRKHRFGIAFDVIVFAIVGVALFSKGPPALAIWLYFMALFSTLRSCLCRYEAATWEHVSNDWKRTALKYREEMHFWQRSWLTVMGQTPVDMGGDEETLQ